LLALPRPHRQRFGNDRGARIQTAAFVSHRPAAAGSGGTLLRRDLERLRRDAELRGAGFAARQMGDCRLHSRAAIQREREYQRFAGGSPRPSAGRRRSPAAGAGQSADCAQRFRFCELPGAACNAFRRSRSARGGCSTWDSTGESTGKIMTTTEQSYDTTPQLTDTFKKYQQIATFVGLIFLAVLVSGYFISGPEQ